MNNTPLALTKLRPEHTKAGIRVCYDDHCVSLRLGSGILHRVNNEKTITMALWTGPVTLEEIVAEANHYLNAYVCSHCGYRETDNEGKEGDICQDCGLGWLKHT